MCSQYRASSSRCFHICVTPLNVAALKQKKLLIVAKLSRITGLCRMNIFRQVNRKEKANLCLGKLHRTAAYQFYTCI